MNTIRVSLLILAAALFAGSPQGANAGSIAVDFVGGSAPGDESTTGGGAVTAMTTTEIAGVVPQPDWNNAGIGGQTSKYVNNVGQLAAGTVLNSYGLIVPGLSVAWNAYNTFSTLTPDDPGNDRMMKGYLDTSSADPYDSSTTTVELFNIPNNYTTGGYDLYIYYDGLFTVGNPPRAGEYQVFDVSNNLVGTIYAVDSASYAGSFIQASGTSIANATSGNYIEFTDLTSRMITIEATGVAGDVPRAPINGIQIVALVPEPPSIVLLLLSGIGLSVVASKRSIWPARVV